MSDIATLQQEVKDHEPHLALTDNSDGLSIVRKIITRSPHYLAPGGVLLMEIGIGQADDVLRMFDKAVWQTVEIFPDLQMIPRMVFARLI
jgi:release factor glutamine methyltransferase